MLRITLSLPHLQKTIFLEERALDPPTYVVVHIAHNCCIVKVN